MTAGVVITPGGWVGWEASATIGYSEFVKCIGWDRGAFICRTVDSAWSSNGS